MPQFLTAPEVQTATRTYQYYVQLISTQLDPDGVTESTRLIDVLTTEPTRDAITLVIAACPWLAGYEIVSYWRPEYDECPF